MEKTKPITNPMLVGAMELLKAEDTPEHRRLFVDELVKARLLSPGNVTPQPQPDEQGRVRLTPENKINIPMLTSPDGKNYFMAFTDMGELQKWKKEENQNVFAFNFVQYNNVLMAGRAKSDGFVINPYSNNLIITRETAEAIYAAKYTAKNNHM